MADTYADAFNFGDFNLLLEDTLGSGTFTGFCGIQNAVWDRSADVKTTVIPNCDPDLPGTTRHFETSRTASFTADGTVDAASFVRFEAWWNTKEKRNVRLFLDVDGARGGGYWAALASITKWTLQGAEHDLWKFSIAIMLDDEPVFTPAA